MGSDISELLFGQNSVSAVARHLPTRCVGRVVPFAPVLDELDELILRRSGNELAVDKSLSKPVYA